MLTKTDFMLYLNAPMHLWAAAHNQLETRPPTLYEQHLSQQGHQVESLGHTYLEDVLLPHYTNAQLIWQPSYETSQYKIRADALILDIDAKTYDLYEIKSSTSINKRHIYDLSFQLLVLETSLNLRDVYLLHIDKTYLHQDNFRVDGFFTVERLTQDVEKHRDTIARLREQAWTVTQMEVPQRSFACSKPRSCPCPSLCHPRLPENPIYNIPYIGKKAIQLREMGITAIEDIPPSFNLNKVQRKHFKAVKSGQPIVSYQAIQTSLANLQYPLHFLDYETFNPAIPLFHGYHPYEHIVYQYSLHVINHPGAEPQHFECLLTEPKDPIPELVPDLFDHLGPQGSVVVWNQSFEAHRNRDMAKHYSQYAQQLLEVNERLYDLMRVFKDGHYVHPDFHGSASLKAVLPALCPELQYNDLVISNGEETMLTWYRFQTGKIPIENQAEIREAMKEYCKMDTFGMIAILEKLYETIRSYDGS
ncbi:MAG: DUF2779 domain-containing protein [Chloroflexota bacterium]|nr:DUF2779 domain-containing protein [Chloroflexota bacterium]